MTEQNNEMPKEFFIEAEPVKWTWLSKSGTLVDDFGETVPFPVQFSVVGFMHIYARWTETIGSPMCYDVHEPCCDAPHDKGIRAGIMIYDPIADDVQPVYVDLFGLAMKGGQRIVNLVNKHGPQLVLDRVHKISTKHGDFFIPVADVPDERSLSGGRRDEHTE